MRTIRSRRLTLVPVTVANADTLWNVLQQPDLREFQDLPEMTAEAFKKMVSQRPPVLEPSATGRFEWLIYFRARAVLGDEPLGWVSLRLSDRNRAAGEIGYSVVRARRGQGIASEAVAALIGEGFDAAGLTCVRAYCVPENMSSQAVLRRNGFRSEGLLPHGATVKGRPVDVIGHTLERKRWESRHRESKCTRT